VAVGAAAAVVTSPRVQAAGRTVLATVMPRAKATPARRAELRALVEQGLAEVAAARTRCADESLKEALVSMEEALATYGGVLDEEDVDVEKIGRRIGEVIALARSCEPGDDEDADAFRALGLKRDATLEDAKRVYRDLARVYHADMATSGVDPDKFKEIAAAFERVRAYLSHRESA
jgi:hypothetical protein